MTLLSGCVASKSYVQFEVLEPAEVDLSKELSKVLLVNRAPRSEDAFSKQNQAGLDKLGLFIIDSLISNNIERGFSEGVGMDEMNSFEELDYSDSFRRRDTIGKNNEISIKLLKEFSSLYGYDAVIGLDYYSVQLDRSPKTYDFSGGFYYEEYRLVMELAWSVYLTEQETLVDRFRQVDTMYYMNNDEMSVKEYVSTTEMLREASRDLGFRYALRLFPLWQGVERTIYSGRNDVMKTAFQHSKEGEWDKAEEIWKRMIGVENKVIAAMAYHNMSVLLEIDDQIDLAYAYSSRALELWGDRVILQYNNELSERRSKKEKLLKQMQ